MSDKLSKKKSKSRKIESDTVQKFPEDSSAGKKRKKRKQTEEEPLQIEGKTVDFRFKKLSNRFSDRIDPKEPSSSLLTCADLRRVRSIEVQENGRISYTINTFAAELLQNLAMEAFSGSNFCNIIGYGLSDRIDLRVVEIPSDAEAIRNLWFQVLESRQTKKGQKNKHKNVFKSVQI